MKQKDTNERMNEAERYQWMKELMKQKDTNEWMN